MFRLTPAVQKTDMLRVLLEEVPLKVAVRIAARLGGGRKNDLYQLALQIQGESKPGQRA